MTAISIMMIAGVEEELLGDSPLSELEGDTAGEFSAFAESAAAGFG